MTELKTLKDIGRESRYCETCGRNLGYIEIPNFESDLRAEAIKWVEFYRDLAVEENSDQKAEVYLSKVVWIKDFFNLRRI